MSNTQRAYAAHGRADLARIGMFIGIIGAWLVAGTFYYVVHAT